MNLRSEDLDSVGEFYSLNDFRQLVVSVESAPAFLGGLGELEYHRERGLVGEAAFRAHGSMIRAVIAEIAAYIKFGRRDVVTIGSVGWIKRVGAKRGRKLRVLHEAQPSAPAYAAIRGVPREEHELLTLMAVKAFVECVEVALASDKTPPPRI